MSVIFFISKSRKLWYQNSYVSLKFADESERKRLKKVSVLKFYHNSTLQALAEKNLSPMITRKLNAFILNPATIERIILALKFPHKPSNKI